MADNLLLMELILIAGLILLNAFFAASEVAITNARKTNLKQLMEEGSRSAAAACRLAEESSRFLALIQIGLTLTGFFAAATAAVNLAGPLSRWLAGFSLAGDLALPIAIGIVTLVLATVMLILGQMVPQALALSHADTLVLWVALPLSLLEQISHPLVHGLTTLADLIVRLVGGVEKSALPFVTTEEIRTIVDASEEEGILEQEEKAIIYGVFDMAETPVREVMVPRTDMFTLSIGTTLPEVLEHAIRTTHSRIPVYDGSVDNIIGIIHVKDLLRYLRPVEQPIALRDLIRPTHFVPESKRVGDLLREMQQQKSHMAIVIDEYGGTAGLVTIEDLLEELVGEIRDEYDDKEEAELEVVGEQEVIASGRTPLSKIEAALGIKLEATDVETIGGYLLDRLGKIPAPADRVEEPGLILTILSTQGRRIRKVRLQRLSEDRNAEDKAPSPLDQAN